MVKFLLIVTLLASPSVFAGYLAEFERVNKSNGEVEKVSFQAFGRNSVLLREQANGQIYGWLYFDGGDYLVRRNSVEEWRLIGIAGHGASTKSHSKHRVAPNSKNKISIDLQDTGEVAHLSDYRGNKYEAQVFVGGELVEKATLSLSQHRHITSLRDDYLALLEGMSRRSGMSIGEGDAPREMRYARSISVMARGGVIAYEGSDYRLQLKSIENGTGPIFLPAAPEFPEADEIEQLALNFYR